MTVSLALLSWLYLILPYVHNPALSWLQKAVTIAYPIGDVLVLAMLARFLAAGAWRTRSVQLLTLGSLGLLASDVSFGLLQLYSSFHPGTATDLGWLVFYAAWGAAALHPTMTTLTEPIRRSQPLSSPFRLVLIMLAALVAPVVLFVESVRGQVIDAGVIAVCSALLYLLVLSRLADVAAALRRALVRAEVLRQAGAALAGGGDRGAGGRRGPVRGGVPAPGAAGGRGARRAGGRPPPGRGRAPGRASRLTGPACRGDR